jgi:hypothetical protein
MTPLSPRAAWRFSHRERIGLALAVCVILAYGTILEFRTALRNAPMTDLGVFACAAGAVRSGENIYSISDWHGWHYQYPPTLAILLIPLSQPVPPSPPILPAGVARNTTNTPWGYRIEARSQYFGLHAQNIRFFWIVAAWYAISVALICFSAHALACVLEGVKWAEPPPTLATARRRWWLVRTLPLLICGGSLVTDLSRGQVDVLMLAAISAGIYLIGARQEFTAGICFSFPATVKLFPPFLLLYPFWRQRWRMSAGIFVGLILLLVMVPSVALGPARTIELYRNWVDVLAKPALGHGSDRSRAKELTGMTATDNQSLLAFIHNWKYHNLPRMERPPEAAPGERYAVYVIGAVMLIATGLVAGIRRQDGPMDLLIISGILIGMAFIVSPIVHNYYYLGLLPLVAGLLKNGLENSKAAGKKVWGVLGFFMLADLLARVPGVGNQLRDLGVPMLSMVAMMCLGAWILLRKDETLRGGTLERSAATLRGINSRPENA